MLTIHTKNYEWINTHLRQSDYDLSSRVCLDYILYLHKVAAFTHIKETDIKEIWCGNNTNKGNPATFKEMKEKTKKII